MFNKEEIKLLKFYFIYIKNWKTDISFSHSREHHERTIFLILQLYIEKKPTMIYNYIGMHCTYILEKWNNQNFG